MVRLCCYEKPSSQGSDWIALLVHGGGGTMIPENHPTVKFLWNHQISKVLSLELPMHGQSTEDIFKTADAAIEEIRREIEPKIQKKKLFLIGYSIGGILLTKLWYYLRLERTNHRW